MITKAFYSAYFFLGILACVFAYLGLYETAIVFRGFSLFVIFILYYQIKQLKDILFYLGLIFHGIAESLMLFGIEHYHPEINICFTLYGWILILLLRNNTHHIKFGINRSQITPFVISSLLVGYLTIEVWLIINIKIKDTIIYSYIFLATFLFSILYIGRLYIDQYRNNRYILLLIFLITIITSTILGSIEGLFFDNKILAQFVFFIQIISHYFLFKFLISRDEEIVDIIDEY